MVKIGAAALGVIAGAFGGLTPVLYVLLGLMVADFVSGWAVAALGKSLKTEGGGLDSKVGWKGLIKKGLIMLVVLVATQLDIAIGNNTFIFRDMAVWFYIANEGLSFLENLALVGVPFPDKLKDMLEQVKESKDKPPDAK